ncbi:hypothetical protein Glove_209g64 [Diversispora epigaea]|uniref:Uncharacterized protein n=1 Tax=Diversispora epigaea TaxID=1348612 RepID=A0A397INP4_9GLOM|nr:hypothetical protein Glove_209g64 [Diversispora epigaea]
MSLDSDNFSQIEELQSIQKENLPPVSEISYQYESDLNYAGDVSLRSEEFENFDEILSEKKSDTNMSNTLEEFESKSLILQDNIKESEIEIKEFPNEAYADLMTLVTKHNFSNKVENSIIKFFNRHSDLSQSPLPKNIETGRKFMDKINISQLSYSKYCILHQGEKSYAEQNSGNWWKYAEASIPSSASIIKRRVTEELHKTPTALIYTSKLFEFKLLEASIFFEQQKKNLDLTENVIKGFAKFLECLDLFFNMLNIILAEDC